MTALTTEMGGDPNAEWTAAPLDVVKDAISVLRSFVLDYMPDVSTDTFAVLAARLQGSALDFLDIAWVPPSLAKAIADAIDQAIEDDALDPNNLGDMSAIRELAGE